MVPTGDFKRFNSDILIYYPDYDEITFGILVADPRQNETREYIYNYLNSFHNKSGKLFNFFIPGYEGTINNDGSHPVSISHEIEFVTPINEDSYKIMSGNICFQFNARLFDEFCDKLDEYFGIQYTFNPMLILMSMKPGHVHTAKYIVIELDDNERHSARRSGMFFKDLFKAIRTDPSLEHIQRHMEITYAKGNLLDSIINAIGISWLTEITTIYKESKRYRINSQ